VGVDWPTIVASVIVSAVVGAGVSWYTARHVAGREEQGKSAVEARRAIRQIVGPELTKVRQYQAHAAGSMGRDDDGEAIHAGDLGLCARLLLASDGLPRWRRLLVRRRLRQLFGPNMVALCDVHGETAADPSAAIGLLLNRQLMGLQLPDARLPQPDRGQFDQALRCPPNSPRVSELIRSLERLARSR
jgi:hypothetical protein